MKLIESLEWRYATKKFDPSKKIEEGDLDLLKKSIQLSASSYGLQAYKALFISSAAIKEKLLPASWNQQQIVDASHVVVLCNDTSIGPDKIDQFLDLRAKTLGIDPETQSGYGDFMKSTIGAMPEENLKIWTSKQTYIALGNLLAACGELHIDACPMEGFDSAQYDEILGLKEQGLSSAVVATIGYRSEEDVYQNFAKVRKPFEELFVDL